MLKVKGITFAHAHSQKKALEDVTFMLLEGQGLLLTGASGSGKSTLLSILAGLYPRFLHGELTGEFTLDGVGQDDVAVWSSRVGFMTQNPEIQFIAGNVEDELYLTLRCREISGQKAKVLVEDRLKVFGLEAIRENSVFQLSEGQKQKVVLASLTALKPRVLLLDEPSANLDPVSLEELGRILKVLVSEGVSLLIADHRLAWLRDITKQILVLDGGKISFVGDFESIKGKERRKELGLREIEKPVLKDLERIEVGKALPYDPKNLEGPLKENSSIIVENISFSYPGGPAILEDISLSLPSGKVTALIGPSGRGKTTLAKILCGLEKPLHGQVLFAGEPFPADESQVVLQNTDHQLYMSTVLGEMLLALGGKKTAQACKAMGILELFNLHHLAQRHPQSLSGGEKQRLVVAVGLARPTRLLVLDEPTSGLDGHNLTLMAEEIKKTASSGPSVVIITHDLELINLSSEYLVELG
ncbi:MAG: ATP-binding cassette domain-containing protein [Deltaproteobacteria bacterium]|jgi:energy-coupling factor transport system ATP-binding protein|nr:ATP-binding cassette domain-containing protein [Deltaproteobacteria bacterium]